MQSINRLSDDLLIDIFELIDISDIKHARRSSKDLLSLICCSRRFRQLGEPVLYRTLMIKSRALVCLPNLISTALSRPNLMQHVRTIEVPISTWSLQEFGGFTSAEETQIRALLKDHSFSPELVTSWAKDIADGVYHAFASFILLISPNVMELRISSFANLSQSLRYIAAIFKIAAESRSESGSNPPLLLRLKALSINFPSGKRSPALRTIFRLLIQHPFICFEGSSVRNGSWRNFSPPVKLQLTSLRLEMSNLDTTNLADFLHYCPALKMLHYEHDRTRNAQCFLPQESGSSIGHLKPGLEVLTLYRGSDADLLHYNPSEFTTIGSLAGFQKLKTLSISTDLLLGPQAPTILQRIPSKTQIV